MRCPSASLLRFKFKLLLESTDFGKIEQDIKNMLLAFLVLAAICPQHWAGQSPVHTLSQDPPPC